MRTTPTPGKASGLLRVRHTHAATGCAVQKPPPMPRMATEA
ncbi:hypothetical protein [Methylovulum sp.]|nr:hypothetical protein [Methylovulum sp.]MDD5125823.1 hypothetical protein [Methylovulum sp.]